jgi:SOS response regulatory protein OraA/RecX
LVDDRRYALGRAAVLSDRGLGDAAVAELLERDGVPAEHIGAAIDALEPERARAERLFERRGGGARALRALASRGFADDTLEPLIARDAESAIG